MGGAIAKWRYIYGPRVGLASSPGSGPMGPNIISELVPQTKYNMLTGPRGTNSNYPARACASKGLCDRSWCLYIIYLQKNFELFFYLSKYSLSDTHFNTGRLLFEFNRLQYTLAAPEVFVSSANPVSLPSGYRVSIVRNTNIDQMETTPLRYCMLHAQRRLDTRHNASFTCLISAI